MQKEITPIKNYSQKKKKKKGEDFSLSSFGKGRKKRQGRRSLHEWEFICVQPTMGVLGTKGGDFVFPFSRFLKKGGKRGGRGGNVLIPGWVGGKHPL